MTVTVAQLSDTLQTVLTSFADQIARQTGFLRRQRIVSGSCFVQALVFGWASQAFSRNDFPVAVLEEIVRKNGRS